MFLTSPTLTTVDVSHGLIIWGLFWHSHQGTMWHKRVELCVFLYECITSLNKALSDIKRYAYTNKLTWRFKCTFKQIHNSNVTKKHCVRVAKFSEIMSNFEVVRFCYWLHFSQAVKPSLFIIDSKRHNW